MSIMAKRSPISATGDLLSECADVLRQLYDAFGTFGLQSTQRENVDGDSNDGDLFYADSVPRRRHRTTRPLGDMVDRASTGLWAGWDVGQSDDGRAAAAGGRSTTFDAEHPMRKYRRRKRKKNGRRPGRNNRIGKGRVLEATTTTTTTTTPAPQSNQVTYNCCFALEICTRQHTGFRCLGALGIIVLGSLPKSS